MGVRYEVEPAKEADLDHDSLSASYGWAHYHAFVVLLAAEEGIVLDAKMGYGGTDPWTDSETSLRPLFDIDFVVDGRLPAAECQKMQPRLREISERWSRGLFAGESEEQMKLDQNDTLCRLVSVVDACVRTGRALTIH
ncbi:MAG TPA: hypothetical protein DGG94_01640 [Micromonosporaceae bacterium]|nr:hypothetical protein [Micromonosporaceae bacterium]HCU48530.1 hypothetical protein [Micromonosporaceae bacterium]